MFNTLFHAAAVALFTAMPFLTVHADMADPALRFTSYATADSVEKLADDPEYRAAAPDVLRRMHVSKIILEVYRGGTVVAPEKITQVRDFFLAEGFQVWGGIATVPGENFGVRQDGAYGWFNWQAEKTQSELLRVMTDIAPIFDTFIVDDFLCTDDKSAESDAARAGRSWGEYRRDLMVSLSQKLFIAPLKAAKPDGTVIIKYPQWYDRFHLFGYDVERQPQLYGQVWVGTETRGQFTQRFGFTQPYEGFVNYRWLSGIAGQKKGGAWFDYGDCDADDFLEQAYQTVLAGAPDIVFFNFDNIATGHPGNDLFIQHLDHLQLLARQVAEHPATGIPAYKPMNSDPGPDMYLLDFLGMLGIPVIPTHAFPADADTIFLPAHAAHDPQLLEKVETANAAGKTLIFTTGLLIARPELGKLAGLNDPLVSAPVKVDRVAVKGGKTVHEIKPAITLECAYYSRNARISAAVSGEDIAILARNRHKNAEVWVFNSHTYDQSDFDAVGEVLLCPRPLGILELPQVALNELRAAFNDNLGFTLDAPSRVCIQPLGDSGYVLHNYNREPVTVSLRTDSPDEKLYDIFNGGELHPGRNGVSLTLPARSRIWLSREPLGNAPEFIINAEGKLPEHLLNPEIHSIEVVNDVSYLKSEISQDPYKNNTTEIRLQNLQNYAGHDVVIECRFLDQGAGLMRASLNGAGPARMSNYTRLNTGRERTAWFGFRVPENATSAVLSLTDVQYLKSVRMLPAREDAAWRAMDAAVPRDVEPMFTLERPMQLVTTAGVDVTGDMDALESSLRSLNEIAPLARVLGFTSIESYVTWKRLEPNRESEFDFTFYDAIVNKLAEYDLKWFPLLIVGSGYSLPDWFMESKENIGFVCLEHGLENPIQSIWSPYHQRHVTRVLEAFGKHYEPMGVLEGVRLGPSGNYGESQYPAGGNWGPKGKAMHIHIGWWGADTHGHAAEDYRAFLRGKYTSIEALNTEWGTGHKSFDAVEPRLPEHMLQPQERLDFTQWYTDSMTEWCDWWAREARRAMPNTVIHQSAGGWGFREAGTDYAAQAKSMAAINGGIRLTNETDSYEQNFYATRLACTAARHYGVPLGFEPASSHTARGTAGRIFHTLTNNGDHFFTYHNNIMSTPLAIQKWLEYAPLFDLRQPPRVEVAVYYPETYSQIDDSAFRYLYAWGFNPRAAAVRRAIEVDYLDERLIREGYLDQYKVLVFVWGNITNADVLEKIDAWVQQGGVVIYPAFPRGPMTSVEGDATPFKKWEGGNTGAGAFHRFPGDMEPPELYGNYVCNVLRGMDNLTPEAQLLLSLNLPGRVFASVQLDGSILFMNYRDDAVSLELPNHNTLHLAPYSIGTSAQ